MRDALKNYLTLASGLTEVGRQRAIAASKALVAQGEATAEQVSGLADDLIQTSKTNRDMISTMVRTEVERAMAALGVATADSVEFLTKRLQTLEAALREATGDAAGGADATAGATAATAATAAAKPAKAARKAAKRGAAGGGVTSTHDLAGPAKKASAKTAKPAKAAAASGGAAKPAQAAPAKAAKAPAKKAAKKAHS